ncbi:MAG: YraN family protein, partial [Actinobacteria bacterium]|nr:YraN family protein [Actinomycetota bacterium]
MLRKDALGQYGEEVAARYLSGLGMKVIERNWRCEFGEIDIVASEGIALVVCEVKTRSSEAFGSPFEAIT